MIQDFLLPDLGEGIEGAEVSEILVAVGDKVDQDETVLVLESDKASMEIPLETPGVIKEILVQVGDEINIGQPLFKIDEEEVESKSKKTTQKPFEKKQEVIPPKEEILPIEQKTISNNIIKDKTNVFASPGVRRLSRELNINLSIIKGTGAKGRVTKTDLHGYIKTQMASQNRVGLQNKVEIDFSKWGKIEIQKLTKIKKITGQRLQEAWQSIPHVTQYDEADITDLDIYRRQLKKKYS